MATVEAKSRPVVDPPIVAAPNRRMCAGDFLDWLEPKVRADLLNCAPYMHSPVSIKHALMVNFTADLLSGFARRRKLGHVFREQVAVQLSNDDVVMPDVFFLTSDEVKQIEPNVVPFAPSLVIEVLSPSSIQRDTVDKLAAYDLLGVKEYWILDPDRLRHRIYQRTEKGLELARFEGDILVRSTAIEGFYLRKGWLNHSKFPDVDENLDELLRMLNI